MRLLENLVDEVEEGLFPALKTVRLATMFFLSTFNPHCFSQADLIFQIPQDPDPKVLHRLRKAGIKVYFSEFAPDRYNVEKDFM